jgi:hypothetical protein
MNFNDILNQLLYSENILHFMRYRIKGGGIKYLRYRMKWIKIEIEVS